MITFKQFINERISDVVYHMTSPENALSILKSNSFKLEKISPSEFKTDLYNDYYGMSFARTLTSRFIQQFFGSGSVIFKIDGRKLSQNFKGVPFDFVQKPKSMKRNKQIGFEAEDRLLSKKNLVPNGRKYIVEILTIWNDKWSSSVKRNYLQIKELSEKYDIPITFYENRKALFLQDKSKTVVPTTQEDIEFIRTFATIANKILVHNNKKFNDSENSLSFGIVFNENDIKEQLNKLKNTEEFQKAEKHLLNRIMKDVNVRNISQLVDLINKKLSEN